jgi:hypothetical protein
MHTHPHRVILIGVPLPLLVPPNGLVLHGEQRERQKLQVPLVPVQSNIYGANEATSNNPHYAQ